MVPILDAPPAGAFFFKFESGQYGYALPDQIFPIDSLALDDVINSIPSSKSEYIGSIQQDFSLVKNKKATTTEVLPQPKLLVQVKKRTKGDSETLQVTVGLKRKFEEADLLMDDEVPDELVDPDELWSILNIYKNSLFFKSGEKLASQSLKLSLNIMNKKWVEDTSRMHSDFVIMRTNAQLDHYFAIGEFEKRNINASNAEEFLCAHKDTVKIILEGRAVLKDIATKMTQKKIDDESKKQAVVKLFLIDTSGGLVILKMKPRFHQVENTLHGLYYSLSYSKLLNIFIKEDLFSIMSEIDECIRMASLTNYQPSDNCSIAALCSTPITLRSQSVVDKFFTLPVSYTSRIKLKCLSVAEEKDLEVYLQKTYPYFIVKKTVLLAGDATDRNIPFMVYKQGDSFEFNSTTNPPMYSNPIEVGYMKYDGEILVQVLEITNTKSVSSNINQLYDDSDDEEDSDDNCLQKFGSHGHCFDLNTFNSESPSSNYDAKMLELTFIFLQISVFHM
ncbi:predicted protein [Naegleria gruberi]|uniref:Predicted protein n=1 Tax=Naegleria gruberi TaxID=5762 RepID=D2VML0_NAEGR|nr:uncharacterized protein NAEGRDRAFT_50795 [Naegleria gruberi]EFC42084.1 predicted protein [Naegleria gruberi]|eukprot:XP_002674828.1 predicted protein [Naegleria gruberi strain NEG-M]